MQRTSLAYSIRKPPISSPHHARVPSPVPQTTADFVSLRLAHDNSRDENSSVAEIQHTFARDDEIRPLCFPGHLQLGKQFRSDVRLGSSVSSLARRLLKECCLPSTKKRLLRIARRFLSVRSNDLVRRKKGCHVCSPGKSIGAAGCASEICALRGDPSPIDCWLRISGSRRCEMAQGTSGIRCDPSRHRRSVSAIDGLAHNQY